MTNERTEDEQREDEQTDEFGLTRRTFLRGVGAGAIVTALLDTVGCSQEAGSPQDAGRAIVSVRLTVNGRPVTLEIPPSATLLSVLRTRLNLTGSKEVCDRGACGACTVHVDGKAVNSCMMLAVDAAGKQVTTIEGLARGDRLDPIQEAFWYHDGMQCGYCTPGFIMAIRAVLNQNPKASLEEIKRGCAGNICRCGAYPRIFDAALAVARGDNVKVNLT